jgi:hypothetical protein
LLTTKVSAGLEKVNGTTMPEQVVVIEDEVRDWVTDLKLSSNEQKLITHPHFGQ